jgi:hypothetical protein
MGDWPKGALHLQSMCSLANGVAMPVYGLGLSHNGGFSADAVGVSLQFAAASQASPQEAPLYPALPSS